MSKGLGRVERTILEVLPFDKGVPLSRLNKVLAEQMGGVMSKRLVKYRLQQQLNEGLISKEDYCSTLAIISMVWAKKKPYLTSTFKANVSRALRRLKEKGFIKHKWHYVIKL
jgi:hypothetical protein